MRAHLVALLALLGLPLAAHAQQGTAVISGGINQLTGDVTAGPGSGSLAATVVSIGGHLFSIGGTGGLTFTLIGPTTVTLPTSGTLTSTANNLGVFAATTSAQLAGVISDETGSGALVFGTSPTLTAPVFSSIVNTGTLTLPTLTDTLTGRATTDTLTNKTFDTAGTGNSFSIAGTAITAKTGTGAAVLATSPALQGTPGIAAATGTSLTLSGGVLNQTLNQNAATTSTLTNSTSGTGAYAQYQVVGGTNTGSLYSFSPGWTTSNQYVAGSVLLEAGQIAGLGISGGTAGGPITFWINSAKAAAINAALTASKPVYTDASQNLTSTAPAGYSAVLSGTTAAIGGGALTPGACVAGTATVTGATSSMVATTSPSADPDSTLSTGISIYPFVSSANTVTVRVCAIVAVTPAAVTYNVRVLQ